MNSTLAFDPMLEQCPACTSSRLLVSALTSKRGFMSAEGIHHSKCLDCGTHFVNPPPTDSALADFYAAEATEAEVERSILEASLSRYFDPVKRAYFYEHRIKPLLGFIQPKASLLDVGCGAGVFVRFMRDEGFAATGIDLSRCSIEMGQQRLDLQGHLQQGHWSDVTNQRFDVVTAWTLIEHLKEPGRFLTEAQRLLNPEGILLLELPTVDSLLFEHLGADFFWTMPPYHLVLFSRTGIASLLSKAGFEVLLQHEMPRNWYFIHSICKRLGIDLSTLTQQAPDLQRVVDEADRIFDDVALHQRRASVIQLICRLRS